MPSHLVTCLLFETISLTDEEGEIKKVIGGKFPPFLFLSIFLYINKKQKKKKKGGRKVCEANTKQLYGQHPGFCSFQTQDVEAVVFLHYLKVFGVAQQDSQRLILIKCLSLESPVKI